MLVGNEVVSAISLNIKKAIDSKYISDTTEISAIWKDTPIQNAEKPYAFIHSVSLSSDPDIRDYSLWRYLIDVRCHPKDNQTDVQSWARKLQVKLLSCISKISVEGQQVRAYDVECSVQDNVLHVLCSYVMRVKEIPGEINPMETLTQSQKVRQRR